MFLANWVKAKGPKLFSLALICALGGPAFAASRTCEARLDGTRNTLFELVRGARERGVLTSEDIAGLANSPRNPFQANSVSQAYRRAFAALSREATPAQMAQYLKLMADFAGANAELDGKAKKASAETQEFARVGRHLVLDQRYESAGLSDQKHFQMIWIDGRPRFVGRMSDKKGDRGGLFQVDFFAPNGPEVTLVTKRETDPRPPLGFQDGVPWRCFRMKASTS